MSGFADEHAPQQQPFRPSFAGVAERAGQDFHRANKHLRSTQFDTTAPRTAPRLGGPGCSRAQPGGGLSTGTRGHTMLLDGARTRGQGRKAAGTHTTGTAAAQPPLLCTSRYINQGASEFAESLQHRRGTTLLSLLGKASPGGGEYCPTLPQEQTPPAKATSTYGSQYQRANTTTHTPVFIRPP